MIGYVWSLFWWRYPRVLAYMFQASNYEPFDFLHWWLRVDDFRRVSYRGDLIMTIHARLMLIMTYLAAVVILGSGGGVFAWGIYTHNLAAIIAGAFTLSFYPVLLALIFGVVSMALLRRLVLAPKERQLLRRAKRIFHNHPGKIIAVAGSYGKTSMKELLATVLATSGKVAATPGNKNVPLSHAYFASRLQGDEDYVIVELGEGYPGDIAKMTDYLDPDMAILTGIAPNHLDKYGTIERLAADFRVLLEHCGRANCFANMDTPQMRQLFGQLATAYDHKTVMGWKISDVMLHVYGTSFTMTKGSVKLKLDSGLIGRANIAPLALTAGLAHKLGLSRTKVTEAIAETKPFEHRLEPKPLGGGWIIDDTYNGNLEGMRAGLNLLSELKVKGRKVFVTPGLVDQGDEAPSVHQELGRCIAASSVDEVVLMQNSATKDIEAGLSAGGYRGKLTVVQRPLEYYQNINLVIAAGDIYLLQNDLPDNYN